MKFKTLGKTGLKVSVVGLGGIPIQKVTEDGALEIIRECKNRGINFIDTARGYTVSESHIGKALKEVGRENFIIATKAMAYNYFEMKKNIDDSLEALGVEYIDLYQIHNAGTRGQFSDVVSEDGALKAMVEAREEGKIRHIGITSHNHEILEKALDYEEFDTFQFPYNPVEDQGADVLSKAAEKNIGVIIMKPVAGGVFPKPALSLKYILNTDFVTLAIPGMDSIEQVVENASVAENLSLLTDEEKVEIQKIAKEIGTDFCRRCGYCLPCPQGINIPAAMLLENYVKSYSLNDWALKRYEGLFSKASDCIKCGICEPRCPYNVPIRKRLESVKETFGE
ncbi:Predicted oxidoreductase of the aldo/keto reductase family [Dethiosulfatibacter aminovorans DSM 17477]|uniref:Predicted oxidoreductase of the aldo/keto reductase family n=1 Tax=Dethiosulfatibacter aminovorans DSM 17477 TaxID=1121476 RepID=A0A1M6B4Z3_9FIRM|nr:aldo/keto reductase [Dethiosulfatibacter aminovorans]SHI43786.1 Predicted oxidoreductase of the aldo/keto reductase family [Dethiosulfatibacter aminovorans DSM 17477]